MILERFRRKLDELQGGKGLTRLSVLFCVRFKNKHRLVLYLELITDTTDPDRQLNHSLSRHNSSQDSF